MNGLFSISVDNQRDFFSFPHQNMFPFTFKLSVPGLSNPFSASPVTPPELPPAQDRTQAHEKRPRRPRQRPSPSPSPSLSPTPPPPASRKRGWEPTFAEPSRSTATLASPAGYLDTPAKYREQLMTPNDHHEYHDITMSDTPELPPAKRRRGLAGSIVSTALSAALIGTAVGLTVYRLWRDRGKEAPPPPYQQEWTPIEQHTRVVQVTNTPTPNSTTPSRSRKSRQQVSSLKRPVAHHRRPRVRPHTYTTPPHTASSSSAVFPPTQPEFSFPHPQAQAQEEGEEQGPVADQMDWIGDKLAMLIEEGKRALQSEVVVMSDVKEDEVDDGRGVWDDEDPQPRSLSRSSSLKRALGGRRSFAAPSSSLPIPSASPRRGGFDVPSSSLSSSSAVTPRRSHSRGLSYESALPTSSSKEFEEPGAWASPELRESMEKARARILAKRGS